MTSNPPVEEEYISHDESSFENSGSDTSLSKPTPLKRGGTIKGKSITGRLSKFEDTTTKSSQKLQVVGASLHDLLEFDGQTRTLPLILKNCLDALRDDESIMRSKTLFRTPIEEINDLGKAEREFFSPNVNVNMIRYHADVSAMLLLRWLSNMPEPLLTYAKAPKFEAALSRYSSGDAEKDARRTSRKLAHVVKSLPTAHCNSLHYLFLFLKELVAQSHASGLDASTLSKIFGPVLYRHASASNDKPDLDEDQSAEEAAAANEDSETPRAVTTDPSRNFGEELVVLLLTDFQVIFADLTIEDMETIPEEQLAAEVAAGKRKNQMLRSNSGTIEKPLVVATTSANYRKSMMVSSSAENVSIHHTNSAGSMSHSSSNPASVPLAHEPASPSTPNAASSKGSLKASPVKERDSSAPRERPSPSSRSKADEEPADKEKEKKGFMTTLRKFALGSKEKKDKSPSRGRSGSVSVSTSPLTKSGSVSSPGTPSSPPAEPISPTAVFGMKFEQLLEVAPGQPNLVVPNIVRDCLEFLQEESRSKEFGIFRESGSFNEKARMKQAYDSPFVSIDFTDAEAFTVAALMKDWLRDLPECLLTDQLYKTFKDAVSDEERMDELLHAAVAQLPEHRRICLHYIIHFFKNYVVAFESDNKMSESNVGIVLGPCVHRKENASPDELMDPCHNIIVMEMLLHYDAIFGKWEVPVPPARPSSTIYKKTSELTVASSVMDQINRKMAAEAATAEESSTSETASKDKDSKDKDSKDKDSKDKEPKDKDKKKSLWDRLKEETGGGRRRSSTMQSDTAPFAPAGGSSNRTKVTRSSSIKSNPSTPAPIDTPPRSVTPDPSATRSASFGSTTPTSSAAAAAEATTTANAEVAPSPKVSPRGLETKRRTSTSNLTVRTLTDGSDGPVMVVTTGIPSPSESPSSFGETKRRSKRSRPRELSLGSVDSRAAVILGLTAAQVEVWLTENAFADVVAGLKNTNGKQLFAFSKADLKAEFGIRGVALWNSLHPNENNQEDSSLAAQVALLNAKIDDLLAKMNATSTFGNTIDRAESSSSLVSDRISPPQSSPALPISPSIIQLTREEPIDDGATKSEEIDQLLNPPPSTAPSTSSLAEAVAAISISDTPPMRASVDTTESATSASHASKTEQGEHHSHHHHHHHHHHIGLSASMDSKSSAPSEKSVEPIFMFGEAPDAPLGGPRSQIPGHQYLARTEEITRSAAKIEEDKKRESAEKIDLHASMRLGAHMSYPTHDAPPVPLSPSHKHSDATGDHKEAGETPRSNPSSSRSQATSEPGDANSIDKPLKESNHAVSEVQPVEIPQGLPGLNSEIDVDKSTDIIVPLTSSSSHDIQVKVEGEASTSETEEPFQRPSLTHSDSFPPRIAIVGSTPANSSAHIESPVRKSKAQENDSSSDEEDNKDAIKLAEDAVLGVSHSSSSLNAQNTSSEGQQDQ